MPWNPEKYNQFKNIRYQPFFDLMDMISPVDIRNAVDIGCGTGEQTSILSEKFKNTTFLGIDSSSEMLYESNKFVHDKLQFQQSSIETFLTNDSKWDLIFSNAALQWVDHHEKLFKRLISKLNDGGQLAVQMPVQSENFLNQILYDLVQEKPFSDFLNKWKRTSPVLRMDDYAQIMFEGRLSEIQIIQKVYPIIADDPQKLFDFISGSALIPYLELMSENEQEIFVAAYKKRIEKEFQKFPAIYAFKRILLYGKMSVRFS
ncbi:methyltransferase domain-containing protein [Sphingobacterium phlebotomi]|uniref:Methyltransferase domain-containing protein n=1 Tax=Sphingobacterium phlebotomi TaxID=2605433 RepID=A0A5D4GUW9_9SPHI|nr:methyltransferase domain-containing protein [Sphingobacterium phlebotomi]TYR31812.1 methyltransferase domain-containing protein [Sphingobacterium phlebotomi]